jgi:hypothetical protein
LLVPAVNILKANINNETIRGREAEGVRVGC